jgi:hypothetical protein
MSSSLAHTPGSLANENATRPSVGVRLIASFKAIMESLVAAEARRLVQTEPLSYRFPPL